MNKTEYQEIEAHLDKLEKLNELQEMEIRHARSRIEFFAMESGLTEQLPLDIGQEKDKQNV